PHVPNIAARPWSFLDANRLPEPLRQALAHQASDDVSRSTRRKTDNDAHRPRRIAFRPSDPRQGRQRGSARCEMEKISAGKFHFLTLPLFTSLHHLVCDGEHPRRDGQAERRGGPAEWSPTETRR